ncbi:glutaminyl-peptide cyclotransferase-like [Babylonia areolata]|uniref:glutaminyl-peptide cyclotransferase-like n=1 Tax=Babylonia areolata TaxID=304850 RepID=UPI003FCFE99A
MMMMMMKTIMATSGAAFQLSLLVVVCCSVAGLFAQNTGCASIESPYVLTNLRNLSVGLSRGEDFRDLALRPLISRPRVSGTYGNRLARTHIKTWMESVGWTVEEDQFFAETPYGRRLFTNLIATLDPSKPRRLVLACHHDSKLMHRVRFVGATDAAVPCALLMDTAWRLRDIFMGSKASGSDLTVQFIFFDGEEAFVRWSEHDSLYGSRHLADRWANTPDPHLPRRSYLDTIDTFVLLDLIGTSDTHFNMRFPETALSYNKLQSIESCLESAGLMTETGSSLPLFTSVRDYTLIDDDHTPFHDRGVPILHLITSPFPSVWHTPLDDMQALDFHRIDNLARVLRVFFVDLPL